MATLLTSPAMKIAEELLAAEKVQRAFREFDTYADELTQEQIDICEIPAPPFLERKRAEYLCDRLSEIGLREVGHR